VLLKPLDFGEKDERGQRERWKWKKEKAGGQKERKR